ncbi:hypothetical protein J3R82DRAFT_4392 [Butyriboletus roseoflavus]|nr:hypothetical protein J3R82DRAFT_4392 [Butyriboletus roseoflavus]
MDEQDRRRFVQQYVERQKAYLPTYTTEHLLNERHRTPTKPLRSDEFGFDTPVLRPRVLENKAAQTQLTLQAGAGKSRTRGAEPGPLSNQGPGPPPAPPPGGAPSAAQDTAPSKKDKSRLKRKKASTPIDSDNERAARLADRRERKRKKRAIVNPPQKDDDEVVPAAAPKIGRANGRESEEAHRVGPFLKPALSLGVFSKGKASAKKKVITPGKSASRNELFSESAFLNKPSERVADHSRVDDDSDDSSVSSVSNHLMPRVIRTANRTKEDRAKCTETRAVKTPKAAAHAVTESEVWDIEVQSKLPSSARDVSSDPEAQESAPVVLDLRGAEWAVSINMTEEREERRVKAGTPSLSVIRSRSRGRSVVCGSPPAISDILGLPAPSIHPSHSASQVGRRTADVEPSDLRLATSKYFAEPKPVTVQEFTALAPQTQRSNDVSDVFDSQIPGQGVEDVMTDPPVEFQTRYESDGSPWDDCCARVDVPWEPLGGRYFESSVLEVPGGQSIDSAAEYCHSHQSTTWDWCRPWHHSADLTTDDIVDVPMEALHAPSDLLAAVEPCFFETQAGYDPGEGYFSGQWFCMAETGQNFPAYEDMSSICDSEESLDYGEPGEDVPGFLEGRALLLGVPEDYTERPWCARLSGLDQAEMDVASRLRDHWRPLRL